MPAPASARAGSRDDGGSAGDRLQAAADTASAQLAILPVDLMSELSRRVAGRTKNLAADRDGAADAGPNRDEYDVTKLLRRARVEFGGREGPGVVGQDDTDTGEPFDCV